MEKNTNTVLDEPTLSPYQAEQEKSRQIGDARRHKEQEQYRYNALYQSMLNKNNEVGLKLLTLHKQNKAEYKAFRRVLRSDKNQAMATLLKEMKNSHKDAEADLKQKLTLERKQHRDNVLADMKTIKPFQTTFLIPPFSVLTFFKW